MGSIVPERVGFVKGIIAALVEKVFRNHSALLRELQAVTEERDALSGLVRVNHEQYKANLAEVTEERDSTIRTDNSRVIAELQKEVEMLKARLRLAVEKLKEAREDIDSWAGYASEYFQDKHDLQGCLKSYDEVLEQIGEIP